MEKLSNEKKKWIRSLHHKKYREKYGYFIGEGVKLFNELTKKRNIRLHALIGTNEWWSENQRSESNFNDIELFAASSKDIEQISNNKTPQPPIMVFESPSDTIQNNLFDQDILLYLDGIRDPGNLGTIIRLADWFGHRSILVSDDTVDWKNPKVIQSSMGSFLRVNIITTDLHEYISQNPSERKVIGASMNGHPLDKHNIQNSILVIGNESQGIREEITPLIQHNVSIPGTGQAESLNAAIAAAIFCYQSYVK